MINPDKIFKDKLFDLETPLGGNVSFEKVMAKRNKPVTPIWWKPALLVVATMSVVSLTGYFWTQGIELNSNALSENISITENASSSKMGNNTGASGNREKNHSVENADVPNKMITTKLTDVIKISNASQKQSSSGLAEAKSVSRELGVWNRILRSFGIRSYMGSVKEWSSVLLENTPREYNFEKPRVKPSFEIMMNTGGRNHNTYSGNQNYSVRGNHYFGQYTAIALWDLGRGFQFGGGFGYGQFMGNGEWRSISQIQKQLIDTQTITIVQPGLPDKTVTIYDTTLVSENQLSSGNLRYRMSKVSLPVAFRFHLGEGRTLIRFSGTVSPGLLSYSSGNVFNEDRVKNLNGNSRSFTLDARAAVGVHYLLTRKIAIIAEPGMFYQSVQGNGWNGFNRLNLGMGLGMVIKP